jgi:hypothetical protein
VRQVTTTENGVSHNDFDASSVNTTIRITKLVAQLAKLPPTDPFRQTVTTQLIDKLYNMGIIPQRKSLAAVEKLSASAFCR